MLTVIITGVAGLILLRWFCTRAPMATICAAALVGFGVQSGVIQVVPAIAGPIHRVGTSVRAWQHRQSARLACEISQSNALESEDQARLAQADKTCASAD